MTNQSPDQQLIDMAESETDPFMKELLYGTVGVKMAVDAWNETHREAREKK
jgi:hypothetical protein